MKEGFEGNCNLFKPDKEMPKAFISNIHLIYFKVPEGYIVMLSFTIFFLPTFCEMFELFCA